MTTKLVFALENKANLKFYDLLKGHIYHSKYIIKKDSYWITRESYLKHKTIKKSYNSELPYKLGFLSCLQTKFFCIDIDAHGINDNVDLICNNILYKINHLFGVEPSKIEKTNRGIHCFYFLEDYINSKYFSINLKNLLKVNNINAEIRGTYNEGISFPIKANLINGEIISDIYPSTIFSSLFIEKDYSSFNYTGKYLMPGESNSFLCKYVPYYKFTKKYSSDKIADILLSSMDPTYNGELLNKNRLLQRINSFKDNSIKVKYSCIKEDHKSLISILSEVDKRIEKYSLSNTKKNTLLSFINLLLQVKDNFNNNCSNNEDLYFYNSKYSFSKFYYKQGATPVPSNLFQSLNSHYNFYLNILKEIKFLTFSNGRHYDVNNHVCIHYLIGFVEKMEKEVSSFIEEIINKIETQQSLNSLNYVLNCLSESCESFKENIESQERLIYNL